MFWRKLFHIRIDTHLHADTAHILHVVCTTFEGIKFVFLAVAAATMAQKPLLSLRKNSENCVGLYEARKQVTLLRANSCDGCGDI